MAELFGSLSSRGNPWDWNMLSPITYMARSPVQPLFYTIMILFCAYVFHHARRRVKVAQYVGKVIIISGCDTGFGALLACQSAKLGFTVYAGCLTEEGCERFERNEKFRGGLFPFRLDVTSADSIKEATALIKSRTNRVHALVNNAGIGLGGLSDWMPMSDYRRTMDVNFFGHVEMTKSCMGLLTARDPVDGLRGRIINVSSVAGMLGAPGLSAYCASKFALEGWSDALRREMAVWAVPVVLIEPSFLRTPILEGHSARARAQWEACSHEVRERWGEECFTAINNRTTSVEREAESPQLAVDAMLEALTVRAPSIRYKAGLRALWLYGPLSVLPGPLQDWIVAAGSVRNVKVMPAGCRT